ncbi:Mfs1.2 [Cerioporus squamosus]|nr:Mfs1.2 [Cerioporus squamosus]
MMVCRSIHPLHRGRRQAQHGIVGQASRCDAGRRRLLVLNSVENILVTQAEAPSQLRQGATKRGFRFWMIFLSICLALFLSALELTAVSTALPVIVNDLQGDDFVWVGAAYSLASTAFLPMSGGVSEIFGRRAALLFALGCFILGSALCGAAQTMSWLVAARTVQGLGGGAILSVSSIVVSDLVSLRDRATYNGFISLTWALASAIGPVIGGALSSEGQWRWLFYLNLPLCAVSTAMVFVFLKLPTPPGTLREKLGHMDWIGNFLVIASTTCVVLGLTWGGIKFPWSSAQVLVPLILGLVGLAFFIVYEARWAKNPIVPVTLLQNRTSISGYIQTSVNHLVVLAIAYYLPTYYQACKDASAVRSGVYILGLNAGLGPAIVAAGVSVAITKKYRPQIWIAWTIFMVGMGIYTTVRADTGLAETIGIPILTAVGAGMLYPVSYFPVLSPLPVEENAHALAFFSFCRSFSAVWGIAIGASVLQNELSHRLPPEFLQQLPSGADLSYAAIPTIRDLHEPLKDRVREAFGESIAVIWKVMLGILGIGFLASLFMADVPLHDLTDEKWALKEGDEREEGGEVYELPSS